MNQKIDWQLFSDNELIINMENVPAIFEYSNKLVYNNDSEENSFDYKKNIFTRKTSDINMEINFDTKTCKFIFEEEGNCIFDIECSKNITDELIILEYKIDDSLKKLVIRIKDIIL